jgi:sugar lactone lactonase YvrE
MGTGPDAIYQINATGQKTVFVPPTNSEYQGLAFDSLGQLYVVQNGVIFVYSTSGHLVNDLGFPAYQGLAIDASNNIFDCDTGDLQIVKLSQTGTVLASAHVGTPNGVAVDRSGNVYVSDASTKQILKFNNPLQSLGTFASTGLNNPHQIAFDAAGNLYAANTGSNSIEKFLANGTDLGAFATLPSTHSQLIGVAIDGQGDVFATSTINNSGGVGTIREYSPNGVDLGDFTTGIFGPTYLAFRPGVAGVPEPSSWILLGTAMISVLAMARRRAPRPRR